MATLPPNVKAIEKALNGAPAIYRIEKHKGLILDVRGPLSAAWRLRYVPTAKANQRTYTISDDARTTPFSLAADKATEILTNLRLKGIDPHDLHAVALDEGAQTLKVVFTAWLEHTGKRRKKPISPRTRDNYVGLFDRHIDIPLGAKKISTINRAHIKETIEKIRQNTSDPDRKQRGLQATKALKFLSSVFEWSLDQLWIESNPCRGVQPPVPLANPNGKQARPPSNTELRQLWHKSPRSLTPVQVRVMRLAILTGRRISEITGAERRDARLDETIPCLFIPANRDGNKPKRDDAVPLAPMAYAIVAEALAASKEGEPLFVGASTRWTTSKALTTLRRAWEWPEPPVRFHDFRSLINDQMAALGIPTELRSRTLHHTGDLRQLSNTVYSAYDFMGERLQALKLWEARLQDILDDRSATPVRWPG